MILGGSVYPWLRPLMAGICQGAKIFMGLFPIICTRRLHLPTWCGGGGPSLVVITEAEEVCYSLSACMAALCSTLSHNLTWGVASMPLLQSPGRRTWAWNAKASNCCIQGVRLCSLAFSQALCHPILSLTSGIGVWACFLVSICTLHMRGKYPHS